MARADGPDQAQVRFRVPGRQPFPSGVRADRRNMPTAATASDASLSFEAPAPEAEARKASRDGPGSRWKQPVDAEREAPSLSIARRMVTASAGMAQKSPQIHRMAAPICWSA